MQRLLEELRKRGDPELVKKALEAARELQQEGVPPAAIPGMVLREIKPPKKGAKGASAGRVGSTFTSAEDRQAAARRDADQQRLREGQGWLKANPGDERLRELEQRWKSSGLPEDGQAYNRALIRAGLTPEYLSWRWHAKHGLINTAREARDMYRAMSGVDHREQNRQRIRELDALLVAAKLRLDPVEDGPPLVVHGIADTEPLPAEFWDLVREWHDGNVGLSDLATEAMTLTAAEQLAQRMREAQNPPAWLKANPTDRELRKLERAAAAQDYDAVRRFLQKRWLEVNQENVLLVLNSLAPGQLMGAVAACFNIDRTDCWYEVCNALVDLERQNLVHRVGEHHWHAGPMPGTDPDPDQVDVTRLRNPPACDAPATGRALTKAATRRLRQGKRRARVHVNLHNGCLVVSERGPGGWRVAGYAPGVHLKAVTPKVGLGGQKRVRAERRKNVHAYLEGQLVGTKPKRPGRGWKRISYDPYKGSSFFYVQGGGAFRGSAEAKLVWVGGKLEVWVRGRSPKQNPPSCGCRNPAGLCGCGKVDGETPVEANPIPALLGASRAHVAVTRPTWPGTLNYWDVVEEDGEEGTVPAWDLYTQDGKRWVSPPKKKGGWLAMQNPPAQPCGSPATRVGVHLIQRRPAACVVLLDLANVEAYQAGDLEAHGACPLLCGWGVIAGHERIARKGLDVVLDRELKHPGLHQFSPQLERLADRLGIGLLQLEDVLCREGAAWHEAKGYDAAEAMLLLNPQRP